MLKLLRRWLGWDPGSGPFDFSDLRATSNGRRALPVAPPKPAARPAQPQAQPQTEAQPRTSNPPKKKKKDLAPMDVLDNPTLTLDKPNDDGFDPYNTGAFNRSTSWEKIGRHKR